MEEEANRSILISSHISGDLEGLCDDLYMIHEGKIILHEDTDVLLGNYGLIKADEEQYRGLDKEYLLRVKRAGFGYECLRRTGIFIWKIIRVWWWKREPSTA